MSNLEQRIQDAMADFDKLELELYRCYFESAVGLIQYVMDVMEEHVGDDFRNNTSLMNSYILHFLLTKWAIGDQIERLVVETPKLKQFQRELIDSEFVYRLNHLVQLVRDQVIMCKEEIDE